MATLLPQARVPNGSAHDGATSNAVGRALGRLGQSPPPPRDGDPATVTAFGRWLAALHTLTPDSAPDLACLPVPLSSPARAAIAHARREVDRVGIPRPALEYCLVWLDAEAPETTRITLTLGDAPSLATAIDPPHTSSAALWSAAAWSDPLRDIGTVVVDCRLTAEGVEALTAAYAGAGGQVVRPMHVLYWQVLATARRAVRSLVAGARVRAGERSLDLALESAATPVHERAALDLIELHRKCAASGGS